MFSWDFEKLEKSWNLSQRIMMSIPRTAQRYFIEPLSGRPHIIKSTIPQNKPRKRFKNSIKDNLKNLQLDVVNWEKIAEDCAEWRRSIREGYKASEAKHMIHTKLKRDLRKGVVTNLETNT